ncbi:hypothetical protein ABC345_21040 [Shouchella sp. 1P09AA]|uniref:hypothetical protein n=1 Tax=unclassified Shouchella TaxID=2893065 RepID=UPI0039A36108
MEKLKRRVDHVELAYRAYSIRTFDNRFYVLKGTYAIDEENGDVTKVADLYYRVRSAQNRDHKLIAKRKNRSDELCICRRAKHS